MTPPKPLAEYTDREIIEMAAHKASEAAASAKWVKNYVIIASILVFAYWALILLVQVM
jgi:hypothetical protein